MTFYGPRFTLVFVGSLLLALSAHAVAHGDDPFQNPRFHETLCAPNPTYELREGEVLIPILLYHFVGRETLERNGRSISRFNVTRADFEAQLALLQALGYHTLTLGEVAAALDGTIGLPERPVVITFDDGWREQYTVAFPMLQQYGMRATFFVIPSYIGYPRFMTWEELKQLRDAGMEIASHGRRHLDLSQASDADAWSEIARSKELIERQLGISVASFAYPYGAFRKEIPTMLERAGYRIAVGVAATPIQRVKARYYLRRIEVRGSDTLQTFLSRLPWRGAGTPWCSSSAK